MLEWVEISQTMRRVLKIDYNELKAEFEWIDPDGECTYSLEHAVLYRRAKDDKLFRPSRDYPPEDCGRIYYLEEV